MKTIILDPNIFTWEDFDNIRGVAKNLNVTQVYTVSKDYGPTLIFGGLNFVIAYGKLYQPGFFGDFKRFHCSVYYPYFGKYLLNDRYFFIPGNELSRRFTELQNLFGGSLFVRPDSCFKPFTGTVLNNQQEADVLCKSINPEGLIVVAAEKTAKEIGDEYRFFVYEDRIIAGSRYIQDGKINELEYSKCELGQKAFNYALRIAEENFVYAVPAEAYVLDISCNFKNEPRLIEINHFNTSGWYDINKIEMINCIEKILEKESYDIS